MNALNRPGIYAGFTSLVLMSALAAPALAQTKTFPPGTDCSKLSGTDMAACQSQESSQQLDGTIGNGGTPQDTVAPSGNPIAPNNTTTNPTTANPGGGGVNQNTPTPNPNGTNGSNGNNGTNGANTSNP